MNPGEDALVLPIGGFLDERTLTVHDKPSLRHPRGSGGIPPLLQQAGELVEDWCTSYVLCQGLVAREFCKPALPVDLGAIQILAICLLARGND